MDYLSMMTPNVVKSYPQDTDRLYQVKPEPYKRRVDLKPEVFELEDQAYRGTCVANGTTSICEDSLKREGIAESLSRLLNDYASRVLILEQPGIEGSTARAGIRAVKHIGLCKESTWPYDLTKWNVKPSDEAFAEASLHKLQDYERIDNDLGGWPPINDLSEAEWRALILKIIMDKTIKAVRSCLHEGIPVAFSCQLGKQWGTLTGPWEEHIYDRVNTPNNPAAGGHEMVVQGYDDDVQRFLIENSWGGKWGDGGFGGMPYDSFAFGFFEGFIARCYDGIYINDPLQKEWDWLQKLYLGFYGRPADKGGLLYWRDRLIREGLSSSLIEAFMTSPEASGLYTSERMREANRLTRKG